MPINMQDMLDPNAKAQSFNTDNYKLTPEEQAFIEKYGLEAFKNQKINNAEPLPNNTRTLTSDGFQFMDQKEGRINPIEKAPVLDMKTNPRLTKPQPGENLLPTEEKSEYWREELRRGKDPREVMNQYLMDRLTQRERQTSPGYLQTEKSERRQNIQDQMNMDLIKSGADFGASFANRRYIDPNSKIPESGFNPDQPKGYMSGYAKDIASTRKEKEGLKDLDQNVLMYLSKKKEEQEKAKADRELKIQLQEMRKKTPEGGAMTEYQKAMIKQRQKELEAKIASQKDKGEKSQHKKEYESLPVEKQVQIKGLAEKITSRKSILADIRGQLEKMKNAPTEDLKVDAGNQMIKTLNSTQGQDAVGTEEAARLAGFLKFKVMNFTEPGSFWGRDVEDFITSAENTMRALESSVSSMESNIDEAYGRKSPVKTSTPFSGSENDLNERYNRYLDAYSKAPDGSPLKEKLKQALEKIDRERGK